MRDDLHKAAPISRALQKFLQVCGRAADRADPQRLKEAAVSVLAKEILRNLPKGAIAHFAEEDTNPKLFRQPLLAPSTSAFQHDLHQETLADQTASMNDLMTRALLTQIDSQCNESTAAMLAEGGRRQGIEPTVSAFRTALRDAIPDAIVNALKGNKQPTKKRALSLDDPLAPGPRTGAA